MCALLADSKNRTMGRSRRKIPSRYFQGHGWRKRQVNQRKRRDAMPGLSPKGTRAGIAIDPADAAGISEGILSGNLRGGGGENESTDNIAAMGKPNSLRGEND